MSDNSTPKPDPSLQELLRYREALQQEYETTVAADPDQIADATKSFFKEHMVKAAKKIVNLMDFAESENLQFSAAKFIIAYGAQDAEKDGDPVKAILEQMAKAKPTKAIQRIIQGEEGEDTQ